MEKKGIAIKYWEHVQKGDKKVSTHRSLDHLEVNAKTLGVSIVSVQRLKKARSHYNHFSHPGMMGMASRMDLGDAGPIFLGGSFDGAKLPAYKKEFDDRIGLSRILPTLITDLIGRLKAYGRGQSRGDDETTRRNYPNRGGQGSCSWRYSREDNWVVG